MKITRLEEDPVDSVLRQAIRKFVLSHYPRMYKDEFLESEVSALENEIKKIARLLYKNNPVLESEPELMWMRVFRRAVKEYDNVDSGNYYLSHAIHFLK